MTRIVLMFGRAGAWLLPVLVIASFLVAALRYGLGISHFWSQDLLLVIHGTVFLLAIPWGLVARRHVRIDVIRKRLAPRTRHRLEQILVPLLAVPMMVVLFIASWNYVAESWSVLEGSSQVSGLPGLFLYKSLIPLFAVLMVAACLAVCSKDHSNDVD